MTGTTIGRDHFYVEKSLSEFKHRKGCKQDSALQKNRETNCKKVTSWTFVICVAKLWLNVSGNTNSGYVPIKP